MNKQEEEAIKKISNIVEECEYEFKKAGYKCNYFDGDTPIPVNEYKILLNLIKHQQKKLKRLDRENQHLFEELFENYISKELIRKKIKEIEDSLKEDCIALHEFQRLAKIDVLKELLGE